MKVTKLQSDIDYYRTMRERILNAIDCDETQTAVENLDVLVAELLRSKYDTFLTSADIVQMASSQESINVGLSIAEEELADNARRESLNGAAQ